MYIVQEGYVVLDERNCLKVIEWFDTIEDAEEFANELNDELEMKENK